MRHAYDGQHMVLAMRFDADIAKHDQVVITLHILESARKNIVGVALVAGKKLLVCFDYPAWRVGKALARRIVACPRDKRADGFLRFSPARPFFGPVHAVDAMQAAATRLRG